MKLLNEKEINKMYNDYKVGDILMFSNKCAYLLIEDVTIGNNNTPFLALQILNNSSNDLGKVYQKNSSISNLVYMLTRRLGKYVYKTNIYEAKIKL